MTALTEDLGYLLSRASARLIQSTNAALADHGLRVRQYSVLALASDTPGGISQRDLASTLGLDPSQIVALVDELEQAKMVERRLNPTDRRTRIVTATDAGREVRRAAAMSAADGQQDILTALSGTDQQRLRRLLMRLLAGTAEGAKSA